MSIRQVPTIICDGCGTVIDADFHVKIDVGQQKVKQPHAKSPTRRDFCCEACKAWWFAEFPAEGPWGPAWDDREWWWEHVAPKKHHTHLRSVLL